MWAITHDEAFSKVKNSLTTPPLFSFFNVDNPTRLGMDASRQGLGFILQLKANDGWAFIFDSYQLLSQDILL